MSKKQYIPVEAEFDEDGVFVVSCLAFKVCPADGGTFKDALVELSNLLECL